MKLENIYTTDINVYSCDMTRNSVKLKMKEQMDIEPEFLKTIEGQNLVKHKFVKVIKDEKKKTETKN